MCSRVSSTWEDQPQRKQLRDNELVIVWKLSLEGTGGGKCSGVSETLRGGGEIVSARHSADADTSRAEAVDSLRHAQWRKLGALPDLYASPNR